MLQALRVTVRGDALLSPGVTRRLISEFVARPPDAISTAALAALTTREKEVVALVAKGLSNQEIAATVFLSEATVKTHVRAVLTKLGLRNRIQVVITAHERGLVRA